jgi:DNA-directed RNA polymerase I, II, and III subunit RPABC2
MDKINTPVDEENDPEEIVEEVEEVLDAGVSDTESDEDEIEDDAIDSDELDDDEDEVGDLSDTEPYLHINNQVISIHETYSNYYSTDKITTPILTKFERAKLLGIRTEMIVNGAVPIISKPYPNDPYKIALEELKQKKIPLIIRRTLPNGKHEDWRLEDLIIKH